MHTFIVLIEETTSGSWVLEVHGDGHVVLQSVSPDDDHVRRRDMPMGVPFRSFEFHSTVTGLFSGTPDTFHPTVMEVRFVLVLKASKKGTVVTCVR